MCPVWVTLRLLMPCSLFTGAEVLDPTLGSNPLDFNYQVIRIQSKIIMIVIIIFI